MMSLLASSFVCSLKKESGDFSGGPVIKSLPRNMRDTVSISVRRLRFHMLWSN